MRFLLKKFIACLGMFLATLFLTTAATFAQDADAPRRLKRPLEVLSLDGSRPEAVPASGIQEESRQGTEPIKRAFAGDFAPADESTSVGERLRKMRRNSMEVNLSRSFVAGPETAAAQHQGELPEVAKRPAGKVTPPPPATPAQRDSEPTNSGEAPNSGSARTARPTPAVPTPAGTGTQLSTQRLESAGSNPPSVKSNRRSDRLAAGSQRSVLLTNRAPAITFETSGPSKITIGQESTYTVRIRNMGDVEARKLVVTVRLPVWADVRNNTTTTGSATLDSPDETTATVNWEIDLLEASGSETLTLGILPRESRPIELAVGWTFHPDQSVAQIEVQEPMLRMEIRGPSEVRFGETATYAITLSNPGTGPARNVVLNLMPTSSQRIAGSRDLGVLEIGERKTVEIELTAHQAGRLQVRAMAQAEGGLRDEASQEVVVRRASLELAVLGPPRNFAASLANYKVRIENTGDAVGENVEAMASLPAGVKFISGSDGARYVKESGQLIWRLGSLQPGASRVLNFQCELHSSGENRLDVLCQADTDLNVAKSVMTYVEALADLQLHVLDPRGATAVGDDAEYEVRIQNRGTKAAEVVQVIGYFSEGIEPIDIRGVKGEVATGQVILDPIPSIEPGQEVVVQITARADRPGNHVFRAELQCNTPETKLAAEEWTKYFVVGDDSVRQASRPAHVKESGEQTFELTPQ